MDLHQGKQVNVTLWKQLSRCEYRGKGKGDLYRDEGRYSQPFWTPYISLENASSFLPNFFTMKK